MNIVDIITTVGFPIAGCIALCWYIVKQTSEFREEIKRMSAEFREEIKRMRDEQNEEMREVRKEHQQEIRDLKTSIDRNSDLLSKLLIKIGGDLE